MNKEIENRFTFHKATESQGEKYTTIRGSAKELALLLNELCPNSRELSVALTKLDEVVMWANAAIARNGERDE
jgi:hypothetical protein